MLRELDLHFETLRSVGANMRRYEIYHPIPLNPEPRETTIKHEDNFYDKCSAMYEANLRKEAGSEKNYKSSFYYHPNEDGTHLKREVKKEKTEGYITTRDIKAKLRVHDNLTSSSNLSDAELNDSEIKSSKKRLSPKDKLERVESPAIKSQSIDPPKPQEKYTSNITAPVKPKEKKVLTKKSERLKSSKIAKCGSDRDSYDSDGNHLLGEECQCILSTYRLSSERNIMCDCGRMWKQRNPQKSETRTLATMVYGNATAHSDSDKSGDTDRQSASSKSSNSEASKKKKKRLKRKKSARLYKFALKRGQEGFKIPASTIKTVFKKLRRGHNKLTIEGGALPNMGEAAQEIKAKILPPKIGATVNIVEWIKMLNNETEAVCWPIWYRIQWVCETGGLADGIENSYRDQVMTAMKSPASKLKDYKGHSYDLTHDKTDELYWDCMWVELLLWITHRFFCQITENNVTDEEQQSQSKSSLCSETNSSDISDSNDDEKEEEEKKKSFKQKKTSCAKVNKAKLGDKKSENTECVWDFYTTKNSDLKFDWEEGKLKCNKCGMAHSAVKGDCTWVIFKDKYPIVQTSNIAKYPNVCYTRKDGRSALRHNIISEIVNYGFPYLGITNVGVQKRIVSDLRYLAKGITSKTSDHTKPKKVESRKYSKSQASNEDTMSDSSSGSSKKNASEEEYVLSSDSNDSGERY